MQTREVKLCNRPSASLIGAKITLSIRVEFPESSPQQNNGSGRYLPISLFPILKVAFRDEIIGILLALLCNIQYDARSHKLFERDLIDRVSPFRKMDWRVDMCSTVLGRRITVSRVVV